MTASPLVIVRTPLRISFLGGGSDYPEYFTRRGGRVLAAAINRQDRIGAIEVGMQADLVILDVPNFEQWAYNPGRNCVRTVIKKGRVVYERPD